jgi:UDP-glucose 4-epimerase
LSTLKVHGEFTLKDSINAESKFSPKDDYAKSKYEAEKGIQEICKNSDMDYIVIRPPLIFGVPLRGNLRRIDTLLKFQLPLPIRGLIGNKRALVSIENLIDFIEMCIASPSGRNQAYLVRDAHHYNTFEIFQITSICLGRRLRSFYIPAILVRLFLALFKKEKVIEKLFYNYEIDINKNYQTLNWQPKTDVSLRK